MIHMGRRLQKKKMWKKFKKKYQEFGMSKTEKLQIISGQQQ